MLTFMYYVPFTQINSTRAHPTVHMKYICWSEHTHTHTQQFYVYTLEKPCAKTAQPRESHYYPQNIVESCSWQNRNCLNCRQK